MTDGHGGYRAPSHPNVVSGPGKFAKRTDGGAAQVLSAAPNQDYGQMKAQIDAQRQAPMAGQSPLPHPAQPAAGPQGQAPAAPAYQGVPFNAPSQRPGEPVTSGAATGPGPGPEALTFQPQQQGAGTGQMTQLLQRLSATDTTGILGQLMQAAQARGA